MNKITMGCLGEQHLLLFGAIIQWFARYELLIQEVISTIVGAELTSVIPLTRNLDFKRQTACFARPTTSLDDSSRSV
jgi:hypothetical protein